MVDREKNLKKSWEARKEEAKEKAIKEIWIMQAEKVPVNFNSVHVRSGLSKNYLYHEPEIRKLIEKCREFKVELKKKEQQKYDKTSKSKDVIIEAKNRRIAKLEDENRRLRSEIELLRGMLYDKK